MPKYLHLEIFVFIIYYQDAIFVLFVKDEMDLKAAGTSDVSVYFMYWKKRMYRCIMHACTLTIEINL